MTENVENGTNASLRRSVKFSSRCSSDLHACCLHVLWSNLQTNCDKSAHKRLASSVRTSTLLEQVLNKLLTTCKKLNGIIRFVTKLLEQD